MGGLAWGLEASAAGRVFGVDEVGRGPWAGPVVAAAACLSADSVPDGLADSKRLPAARRRRLADLLRDRCALGEASVAEIDSIGIRRATHLAMARAVRALACRLGAPALLLVDGPEAPDLGHPARAIVRGDATVASIAAAAIVAKVHRDAGMAALARAHPGYGWETNAGYGTAAHARALDRLGVTVHHRRSFAPIAKRLG